MVASVVYFAMCLLTRLDIGVLLPIGSISSYFIELIITIEVVDAAD